MYKSIECGSGYKPEEDLETGLIADPEDDDEHDYDDELEEGANADGWPWD